MKTTYTITTNAYGSPYQALTESQVAESACIGNVHSTYELDADLPTLTGSEKQVEWAGRIRYCAIQSCLIKLAEVRGTQEFADLVSLALQRATDASWWIDNRDVTLQTLVKEYVLEEWTEAAKKAVK